MFHVITPEKEFWERFGVHVLYKVIHLDKKARQADYKTTNSGQTDAMLRLVGRTMSGLGLRNFIIGVYACLETMQSK